VREREKEREREREREKGLRDRHDATLEQYDPGKHDRLNDREVGKSHSKILVGACGVELRRVSHSIGIRIKRSD
jgi:hypothetical protein